MNTVNTQHNTVWPPFVEVQYSSHQLFQSCDHVEVLALANGNELDSQWILVKFYNMALNMRNGGWYVLK